MKVGLVTPPHLGHQFRGIGKYIEELSYSLKNEGINLIVDQYKHISQEVDLIHFPYFDLFFPSLPFSIHKPLVVTIHDVIPLKYPDKYPSGMRGKLNLFTQKFALKRAAQIITDSYASKKDIEQYLLIPSEKISPVYLAQSEVFNTLIDINTKAVLKKYKIDFNYFLYVGDVNWNKNLPNIIAASQMLKKHLIIVSNSFDNQDQHPWLESLHLAKKEITHPDLITHLKGIPVQDLQVIYSKAVSLVFPSFDEGFGLPILEAFASNCPVITSHRGSLPEIAQDAALYVNPVNVTEIIQTMNKIQTDSVLRSSCVEKGKIKSSLFSWKKTAKETIKVYNKVIHGEE